MRRLHVQVLFTAFALAASCGGGRADSTEPTGDRMRIVAGAGVSDTVLARPVQALVVDLLENGQPKPGAVVSFEGLQVQSTDPNAPGSASPGVLMSGVASNDFVGLLSDTTDQSGRASVLVQLGTHAGDVGVRITCPALGLADTAKFTVRPGNSTQIVVGVRDTVVRAGGSFGVGAFSADRFRNARPQDAVTYRALDALATVDAAGTVQAAQTVGRGTVIARVNALEDSSRFTVVPNVSLTAVFDGPDGVTRFVTLDMDGSNLKAIGPATARSFPSRARSGDLIAFHKLITGLTGTGIELMDGTGSARLLVDPTGAFWSANYPVFSPDSASILFTGTQPSGGGVFRIRLDGSGATRLAYTDQASRPVSVSPDGTRIAYPRYTSMLVKSVATGDSVRIGPVGWFSSFSPDGQRVAYAQDEGALLRVVKVDGSAAKTIWQAPVGFDSRISWMPDGTWVLTSGGEGVKLVNVASNEVIQLSHLSRLREITVNP
jgi:Tol biopolymer transport system component